MMTRERPVYLVLRPTPDAALEADRCRMTYGIDRSYGVERLHSTILRLGDERDRSSRDWDAIRARLDHFQAAPFDVAFDVLDGRLLRGAAGSTGAAHFHRAVLRHLSAAGLYDLRHGFWLHMSLAYNGPEPPRTAIAPIGWRVERFDMIRSVVGEARHELMGSWRLIDRQLALAL